jgi:hypothetical protein
MTGHLPTLTRLGLNRWRLAWPGCAAFECDDVALKISIRELTEAERDELYSRALADARKRAREAAHARMRSAVP